MKDPAGILNYIRIVIFDFKLIISIFLAADLIMSNEHTIDGRVVDVKRALPRDKAPGPAKYKIVLC